MNNRIVLFCIAMLSFSAIFSQGFLVRGSIKNARTKRGVSQTTVILQRVKDSINILNVISDTSGNFILTPVINDTYILKVSASNYATVTKQIVVNNADVNLGDINLQRISEVLQGVTVTTNLSPVSQKADTLQ